MCMVSIPGRWGAHQTTHTEHTTAMRTKNRTQSIRPLCAPKTAHRAYDRYEHQTTHTEHTTAMPTKQHTQSIRPLCAPNNAHRAHDRYCRHAHAKKNTCKVTSRRQHFERQQRRGPRHTKYRHARLAHARRHAEYSRVVAGAAAAEESIHLGFTAAATVSAARWGATIRGGQSCGGGGSGGDTSVCNGGGQGAVTAGAASNM